MAAHTVLRYYKGNQVSTASGLFLFYSHFLKLIGRFPFLFF